MSKMDISTYTRSKDITERVKFNQENIHQIREFFNASKENRQTIICSVRNTGTDMDRVVRDYIKSERQKHEFCYYPYIHNYQQDQFKGMIICNTMRFVIENSGTIALHYNPKSEGSKFDLGIAIWNNKPISLINPYDYEDNVTGLIGYFNKDTNKNNLTSQVLNMLREPYTGKEIRQIVLRYHVEEGSAVPKLDADSAIELGMVFASRRPFKLVNKEKALEQAALEDKNSVWKSYTKVTLMLDDLYN